MAMQQAMPTAMSQFSSRKRRLLTFETFAPGPENELPYNAVRRVAESPVTFLNPLVIIGDTGLGKTHLLDAAVHTRLLRDPNLKVRHLSGEQFMFEFTTALRDREGLAFKELNYNADLFVIDAAEFLACKEKTLEEFMYVVEYFVSRDIQMIISMTQSPGTIVGIPDRLRSMLLHGLVTEIRPPGVELRRKIISAQFHDIENFLLPEVLDYLADKLYDPRILIGAIQRLRSISELGHYIDVDKAEFYLAAEIRASRKIVTIDKIIEAIRERYGVTTDAIKGPRRQREIVRPRQLVMYLACELTKMSYPQIGKKLGRRDHTTVMHGRNKIEELLKTDWELQRTVEEVKRAFL